MSAPPSAGDHRAGPAALRRRAHRRARGDPAARRAARPRGAGPHRGERVGQRRRALRRPRCSAAAGRAARARRPAPTCARGWPATWARSTRCGMTVDGGRARPRAAPPRRPADRRVGAARRGASGRRTVWHAPAARRPGAAVGERARSRSSPRRWPATSAALTGFDRVMVYRFDPEWNGEVVAEDRRPDLEPFLGLHYPASDIPAQARELYTRNWLRLIPDAHYVPVPLQPAVQPAHRARRWTSPAPCCAASRRCTWSTWRNMGVVASMSVSLIDRGRLWGLIACHHYSGPHRPSYADRTAAEFLGRTASLLLRTTVEAGDRDRRGRGRPAAGPAGRRPRPRPRDPAAALPQGPTTLLDLLPAAARRSRLDGRLHLRRRDATGRRVAALVGDLLRGRRPRDRPAAAGAARVGRRGGGRQRRARGGGGRRPRRLPRLVPARDAARGHLGRRPVQPEAGRGRRRPAAVAPAVVRRRGARPCAAPPSRGGTTR